MPVAPSSDFLTRPLGPLPVWAWGGLGLGGAYAISRYRANKQAQSSTQNTTGTAAAQPAGGGPEYIIENNLPWQTPASSPVNVTVTGSPITLPPGTAPHPPLGVTGHSPVGITGGDFPPRSVGVLNTAPQAAAPQPAPAQGAPPTVHRVVSGDNLTKLAEEYGFGANWQTIWQYNTGPGSPRSAADKAKLLRQGPNLIYPGQDIYIPPR